MIAGDGTNTVTLILQAAGGKWMVIKELGVTLS